MPVYLTPGVYVEEIPAQSKPIEGVGTAVAAFVGLAPGGSIQQSKARPAPTGREPCRRPRSARA